MSKKSSSVKKTTTVNFDEDIAEIQNMMEHVQVASKDVTLRKIKQKVMDLKSKLSSTNKIISDLQTDNKLLLADNKKMHTELKKLQKAESK